VVMVLLRWLAFRVMFGAGLIKMLGDSCWRDLTCLYYHYETQPLPNPLSRIFHRFPMPLHRLSVAFSHFVQIVAPFGLFAPQPIASISAALAISQQLLLIVSGNYAWLNWLTVVLGVVGFSDRVLHVATPMMLPRPAAYDVILYLLAAMTAAMSVRPRAKPGDPWFLPFSVRVGRDRIFVPGYELWFIRFVQRLLEGDAQTLRLLRRNPFPDAPPKYIRATYYLYQFDRDAWWSRTRIDDYLPPIMARSV